MNNHGQQSYLFTAGFGKLANLIPRNYTYYISTALFAIFGLKMIRDGYYMSATDAQEELEEVQADLKKREDEVRTVKTMNPPKQSDVMVFVWFVFYFSSKRRPSRPHFCLMWKVV